MLKIEDITICLHCGCSEEVVKNQVAGLIQTEFDYNVHWNNRIVRHPEMYPTYSELINHSVATSPTEWVILINDRCSPKPEENRHMVSLLENGFACVLLYNVGFMGFSKELIRKIGWWDERFIQGWEDRDWVWRLYEHDLAIYESQEAEYDYSWRSPLNHPPGRCREEHLRAKYDFSKSNLIIKKLGEETYPHWDKVIGDSRPDISASWKTWADSKLNIAYDKPNSGPSGSSFLAGRQFLFTGGNS